jgi:hypothetical protein
MSRILLSYLIVILIHAAFFSIGHAQVPTTQDCLGAIPVCDYVYTEPFTATGSGNYPNEINPNQNCPNSCMDGEKNSRWYQWTVVQSGLLRLRITPQVQTDDYDWAVYNLTNNYCNEIYNNAIVMQKSCNAAGGASHQGTTGISTADGGVTHCNGGGPTNKWNADLAVFEGETYVLCVSDWTQTPGGYTLDFSPSTAVIFDDVPPVISEIGYNDIINCGTNSLTIRFSENVKCNTVNVSDFKLTGPGGPYTVTQVTGQNCLLGGAMEREYKIFFTPGLYQSGTYSLELLPLSFVKDACDNYATPNVFYFDIELGSPVVYAGMDIDIPYAGTTQLNGTASGGSGNYVYSWTPAELLNNPNIPNPTTVSLTSSAFFYLQVTDLGTSCYGRDTVRVNVMGGPLGIQVSAYPTEICIGEQVDLLVMADGGSGSFSIEWTSNPEGFESGLNNPVVYPQETTTYMVKVTDIVTNEFRTDEVLVTVKPMPLANAGPDQVINEGTTTQLNGSATGGSGLYIYSWEPAGLVSNPNIPNPVTAILTEPTIFTLMVMDQNGCAGQPDFVLINPAGDGLSVFAFANPGAICLGGSATISAQATGGGGTYTYSWTSVPPGFTSDQSVIQDSPVGTTRYNVLVNDGFTSVTDFTTVTVNPLPLINLIPDNAVIYGQDTIVVCVRDSVVIDAGNDGDPQGTQYYWSNGLLGRTITTTTNGNWIDIQTFGVNVTTGGTGCQSQGQITIIFDFNQCNIDIPERRPDLQQLISVFPNPSNGEFTLQTFEDLKWLNIRIVDQKGRVIFADESRKPLYVGNPRTINIGHAGTGVFTLLLQSDSAIDTRKLVTQ